MRILVSVRQTEALRRGINAPQSTVEIDVDPAGLSERQRAVLADELRDGHKALSIAIVQPTLEGLLVSLNEKINAEDTERAEADAKLEEEINASGDTEQVTVGLDSEGRRNDRWGGWYVFTEVTVPKLPWGCDHYVSKASPEVAERFRACVAAIKAKREALIEAALPALRQQLAAKLAQDAAAAVEAKVAKAAIEAEYEALYARLPEALRARDADGYAGKGEVEKAIQALLVADAYPDYQRPEIPEHARDAEVLTDEQHATLVAIRAKAPEGAEVTAREGWNEYDPCDEHDEYDEECEECVKAPQHIDSKWARVRWTRGGVRATALFVL